MADGTFPGKKIKIYLPTYLSMSSAMGLVIYSLGVAK